MLAQKAAALVAWPGHIAAGRVSDQVTANMDWFPTLLAAAGTAPDPAFPSDGMNLLPHLTQGAAVTDNFTGTDMADHLGMKRVGLDPGPDLR